MKRTILILSIAAGLTIAGCSSENSEHSHGEGTHTHSEQTTQKSSGGGHGHPHKSVDTTDSAHTHSGVSTHSHEGEKPDETMGLDETYEGVRKGVLLTLSYNSKSSSFTGTVKNTTEEALPEVSVVVQLSNGTELAPTTPVTLDAGESQPVELDASGETFESWKAHSEIGNSGHSHGEDAGHEH